MNLSQLIVNTSVRTPRLTVFLSVALFVLLGVQIPRLTVDTDPENMLPAQESARVFHDKAKDTFDLYDMIVVGVVNDKHPQGVFNPASLERIHALTRHIESIDGVMRRDLMSLATVDNIAQDGPGQVRFEWMMAEPPATDAQALAVRDNAQHIPTINGTLISEDGRAAGIYVPIRDKNQSHRIAREIKSFFTESQGDERYFITGLPVAEDTFGVEMFKQMGIAAPLAGLIIFLLMLLFFRSLALVTAPMIIAMGTVAATMGLLVSLGFPVHIMSSMIPIFLMPIAVVDSIHILSEFADLYPRYGDRKHTIRTVMRHLFQPMWFTSLTSAAGFASLAMAPIPPVRVFGIFVAVGILLAFLLTVTFIPAYVVLLSDKNLARLKARNPQRNNSGPLTRLLRPLRTVALSRSKLVIGFTALVVGVSAFGISRIQINDNPVRWFRSHHSIRVADRVLNQHFAGTYSAYLVLTKTGDDSADAIRDQVSALFVASPQAGELQRIWRRISADIPAKPTAERLSLLIEAVEDQLDESADDAFDQWDAVLALLEEAQSNSKYFQTPEALAYIQDLQADLTASGLVGKSNSLVDIVKTVHRELRGGDADYFTVPGSAPGVAQTLLSYQSSHRPYDLWHFVTPDFRSSNIWLQLKSGDNKDMSAVKARVDRYLAANSQPPGVTVNWAGLTYINVVWQDAMVGGMLKALMGSFVIVFIMMLILFRSFWFGLLAMLPLSVTIAFIYGLIGLGGKDYDMPVAILSSLTLGLSVDFAIHFLQRTRNVYSETGDWKETMQRMFEDPARAISRNAIVISIGFLPLLASPLVPYNTVGFFLAAIMMISSFVTLILLPSVMKHLRKRLFSATPGEQTSSPRSGKTLPKVLGALFMAVVLGAGVARAQESPVLTDVNEIISRAERAAYYAGDDGRALVRMTITDGKGRQRRRQFVILRKDQAEGGDQLYAVLFSRPADVRNTVFLVNKHVDKNDDRWLYLPDLDLVKRIAGGDKRTSFVGSDFFYEDVSGRSAGEDTHKLLETNDSTYVILNTPKDPGSVEFKEWTAWIDKASFLPVRMEYKDKSGQLYRSLEALVTEEIGGFPTVTTMKVSDLRSGGFTISEFRNVEYNLGIPDAVFSERTLRNPSPEWFKRR